MFTGVYGVSVGFPCNIYGKGHTVRITEKPYTHQRERLCMLWGNPVILKIAAHWTYWLHTANIYRMVIDNFIGNPLST